MNRASVAALALMVASGAVAEGFSGAPYHDHPREIAQAAALVLTEARAEALGAEAGEETAAAIRAQSDLVLASLERADPETAGSFETALAGPDAKGAANLARLSRDAAHVLGLDGSATDDAFRAAVLSLILLSEAGLAEAYEKAAEGEDGAYVVARSTLDRVLVLFEPFSAAMPPALGHDADEVLSRLDALLPTEPGAAPKFSDPEEAEVLAQALVGLLERALDADLYLSRDLPRALDTVSALAASGCREIDLALGRETLAISRFYYDDALQAPLSVLAGAPHATVVSSYDALLAGHGPVDATACASLAGALADAAATMFPEAPQ